MTFIRPPAVAGAFYPADAAELAALLDHCFNSSPLGPEGTCEAEPAIIAGLAPHAGPIYSGPCAAHLYCRLDASIDRVVIIGIDHRGRAGKASLSPWHSWRTPLGEITVDNDIGDLLEGLVGYVNRNTRAHSGEHSIEIHLPFLQRVLGEFACVPISLSHLSRDECAELGTAIAQACDSARAKHHKTIILASSDLSHYLSPEETKKLDGLALEQVLALDPGELLRVVEDKDISMCGALPTAVMLFAARAMGAKRVKLLKHYHSGDVAPMPRVVGYASVAIEQ
jgi:MEMO1 family protein